ncbi:tetrapyrrole methylase [Chaetomium sp. MPI-SDFR-AT-0129]|nr:tetrapyrrole methylase [Chaetomium sp. MPI-SDFR-AT-0129]
MAFNSPPTALLTAQHCAGQVHLILGANPLAAARASSSLAAGAKPILISPIPSNNDQHQLHYSLTSLIASSQLTHLPRAFTPDDLFTLGRPEVNHVVDAVFVTSHTNPPSDPSDPSDNPPEASSWTPASLSTLCNRHRIPINIVDSPALCSFSLLSVHVDGPLQIGVTTNGRGCKLAGRIRREVAAGLPAGLGGAVERLGGLRRRIVDGDGGGGLDGGLLGGGDGDDSTEQSAGLNKLVREGDDDGGEAAKTRRMRWLAQVCEYWPLRRLAEIGEEDVEGILRSYPGGGGSSQISDKTGTPSPTRTGRVILAGSGPGHPDLLTRATYKAMQTADLILADKLVPAGVLDLIPRRTPVSIARKFPGNADRAQEELLQQALDGVRAGKTVLRLKQGDPFIYGRGGEEVAFFRAHGLVGSNDVVVLPGVTSSLSAPLFAGIPPTQRDVADQVLVCTGTGKKGKAPRPPGFVGSRTVVFLMALHRIGELVGELTEFTAEEKAEQQQQQQQPGEGEQEQEEATERRRRTLWPLTTPCAVIERASCPDQRVIRTTLRFVAEAIEQEGSRPPGLLVVGRACEALYTPEKGRSWVVEDGFKGLDFGVEGGFAGMA